MKEILSHRLLSVSILSLVALVIGYISPAYGQAAPTPLFGAETPPGTSTSDTTPRLRWTTVSGATSYDVRVVDLESSQLTVEVDGRTTNSYTTQVQVRGRDYQWNVRACNNAGCGDFSAPYYFNITGTAPDTPNPLFGSDTPPGITIGDTTPRLQWSSVSGASSYDIVVRNLATDAIVVNVDGRSGTSYTTPSLLGGQTYRWNVRACGGSGCSIYSTSFYFRIVESTPGAPGLLFGSRSAPGTSISDTTPQLRWTAVSGATSYDIDVRDLTSNQLVVNVDNRVGTSYTTQTLIRGRSYRWNVRSCNSSGCGANSSSRFFRISGTVVNTPELLFGSETAPGTFVNDDTPQLRWTAVSGATSYDIDVFDANTGQLVVNIDRRTSTVYTTPVLTRGRNYRWNVRPCNNLGCSNLSEDAYFVVIGNPAAAATSILLLGD